MSSTNKSVFTPQYERFLARLKELRSEAGLKQDELGALLGEYQVFVSRIESGQHRVDVVELRQICRALGVSFVEFVQQLDEELGQAEGEAASPTSSPPPLPLATSVSSLSPPEGVLHRSKRRNSR